MVILNKTTLSITILKITEVIKMKKNSLLGLIALIIAVSFLPFADISAQDGKETVSIATKKGLGSYLVGSNGRTLYYFKNDSPDKSACTGACAERWPVYCYTLNEIAVGKGLKKSDFGSFHRKDNDQDQLTYKGKPLYRFEDDKEPGDTKGHKVKNLWFLVKP